jgi:flavin reductase (DIM6/NTAB) family NADH-FMN oxidoreductase RutF
MRFGYLHNTAVLAGLLFILIPSKSSTGLEQQIRATSTPPLLDVPTYSLATLNEDGSTNMNIVTYATPVSITPIRVWSMGLFKDTLSDVNLRRTGVCVLQLLSEEHAKLVAVLGGMSGRAVDKCSECEKLGFKWQPLDDGDVHDGSDGDHSFQVLPGCISYLKMKIQGGVVDAGSHFIVPFCQVTAMYTTNDECDGDNTNSKRHLSTAKLREWGITTYQGRVSEEAKALFEGAPFM